MRRYALTMCLGCIVGASPTFALAQLGPPPESRTGKYSPYELESIEDACGQLKTTIDPDPEGKTIEEIIILPLDVFEPRDPVPPILNDLHVTTRRYVIAREVLLKQGAPYVRVLADETARNLRKLTQLSLVVVIPVLGRTPCTVRLVVITKDVWSLRLNWDVSYGPGGLQNLLLQPSETNLFGTQQSVFLKFNYLPLAYSLGTNYTIPRLFGSRVAVVAEANVIVNRESGSPEGSFGTFSIQQPLYSTLTAWSWGVVYNFKNEVTRDYVNAQLYHFNLKGKPASSAIPFLYRSNLSKATAFVTRSFGWATKNDITVAFQIDRRAYRVPDIVPAPDPQVLAAFEQTYVGVSDTRVGPYAEYHAYTTNFMRVLDFESLGLQEDFRIGHELYARIYPVNQALGSTRNFIGAYLAGQYTIPIRDGLVRANIEWVTETQPDRLTDAAISAAARVITPRFGAGRLLFDATVLSRYRNYLHQISFLGGDSRLRGYPTNLFAGKDVIAYNLEYRTRPLEIFSVQLGGALFFDAGSAFNGFSALELHHSVGYGFRVLFPQLDRTVFRFDMGFPIEPHGLPPGVTHESFFFGFGQAFDLPQVVP